MILSHFTRVFFSLFPQELRTSCLVKLTVSIMSLIKLWTLFLFFLHCRDVFCSSICLWLLMYNSPNEPNKYFISKLKPRVLFLKLLHFFWKHLKTCETWVLNLTADIKAFAVKSFLWFSVKSGGSGLMRSEANGLHAQTTTSPEVTSDAVVIPSPERRQKPTTPTVCW